MLKVNCEYSIREDIAFILEAERMNYTELAEKTTISRTTLDEIIRKGKATDAVCEKFYSYIFENRYRINSVKEELLKELLDGGMITQEQYDQLLTKLGAEETAAES